MWKNKRNENEIIRMVGVDLIYKNRMLFPTFEKAKKGEMTIENFNKQKDIWLSNLDK